MWPFGAPPPPPPPPLPASLFDEASALLETCTPTIAALLLVLLLCGLFANHFWRVICFLFAYYAAAPAAVHLAGGCALAWWAWPPYFLACIYTPLLVWLNAVHSRQPVGGAVFVTGADSGMGHWTAAELCGQGYTVFAGCFKKDESEGALRAKIKAAHGDAAAENLITIALDVTSDASVSAAAEAVRARGLGLVGIINCAGLGFNGPSEYFPLSLLQQQMEVNFYGYVRVVQALMPVLKETVTQPGARRGRIVLIGTGGGVMSPSPPLLFAYMASKWGVEAFCQTLRMEMQMRELPIDCCMLNPGFIKPTALISGGLPLTERMWSMCPPQARKEYGALLDTFIEYSHNEPGTHVSVVAKTMAEIMSVGRPWSSYKVGPDSKAAPLCGILPTGVRETVVKYSMYKRIGGNM